jgi:hypothetical protein
MPINLEQREISIILDALADRPYMEVAALIRKIVEQTSK